MMVSEEISFCPCQLPDDPDERFALAQRWLTELVDNEVEDEGSVSGVAPT